MISATSHKFIVEGGHQLNGKVTVGGSKNAALPIICAALLSKEPVILTNVPDIADIHSLLEIFKHLRVKTSFTNHKLTIDASKLMSGRMPEKEIGKMRASTLLMGPLLARFGEVKMPFPGGCVLGKRSVSAHTFAFKALGAKIIDDVKLLHLKVLKLHSAYIVMPEMSVTATENAIMLAVMTPGVSQIRLSASEPHVQDLCLFLNKMGAKISGIGTNFLTIEGVKELSGANHSITGDYLEAGTFAIAGILCGGTVEINGFETDQLDSLWQKLDEAGADYKLYPDKVVVKGLKNLHAVSTLRTAVYPSFATDLQAPFTVLLTQAEGESKVFETLFEGRLTYLVELEKMGAKIQILNPHQAIIKGPTPLCGAPIASCDIRAGAAMVLAALCAAGTTEISNIYYIDRGYENLEGKLEKLGAKIKRIN
jgi:UDP-N-acetylglucosamine 1-carboxyvinyltransferase